MKVLIISGVPIRTDTNSGKTLKNLFSDFAPEELSQLYFSPETPNTDLCGDYYRVCEKQMLKSCFGLRRSKCGGVATPVQTGEIAVNPERNPLVLTKNKRAIHIRLARELVWSLTHWKNAGLKAWLKKQNPDVILAVMQDTNGATKAIRWVARQTGCPVVYYITDDYYNDPENSGHFLRKRYFRKRQRLNKALSGSVRAVTGCSGKMTDYFRKELNIPTGEPVFTPSNPAYLALPAHDQKPGGVVTIRYFGNLGLGRWQQLKNLGTVIQKINRGGQKAILEVYSSDRDPNTHRELTIENGCVFKGWVHGEEYLSLLQSADIAVHVESFDESMIRRTWGSVSTKIADYLGAGKCVLAIGSPELASIEHLQDVACVISDLEKLEEQLTALIEDPARREKLQCKARELAIRCHDLDTIGTQVRTILETACIK